MSILMLWGVIEKDGKIKEGSNSGGFTVNSKGNGKFKITFDTAFTGVPAITGSLTNNCPGVSDPKEGQDPRDGIVFPDVQASSVEVITGNMNGGKENREFSFIAIGNK